MAVQDRLEVRMDRNHKSLVEQAAEFLGQTLSAFTVSTLVEKAREVVQQHQGIQLTDRDRDRFLTMLDHPPRPNAALKKAAKRHSESVSG